LIHAATMVAAGVYMLCRTLFLYNADALHVIAYIGGFTALLAALIAVQQNDIKRIIAYSTLSQLGYMVMAVGLERPDARDVPFDHARIFQSAAVLERRLGHHRACITSRTSGNGRTCAKKMPVTFWTFLIGALALSGIPPFSGFYSKDSILAQCLEQKNYLLFAVAVFVAGLTRFTRSVCSSSFSSARKNPKRLSRARIAAGHHAAAGDCLAVFAAIGGFIGITNNYGSQFADRPRNRLSAHAAIARTVENTPSPMFIGIGVAVNWFCPRVLAL
jgi:NADH-quinone oxidoreductase subunit L